MGVVEEAGGQKCLTATDLDLPRAPGELGEPLLALVEERQSSRQISPVRGNQPEIVVDEGNGGGPPRFPVAATTPSAEAEAEAATS